MVGHNDRNATLEHRVYDLTDTSVRISDRSDILARHPAVCVSRLVSCPQIDEAKLGFSIIEVSGCSCSYLLISLTA